MGAGSRENQRHVILTSWVTSTYKHFLNKVFHPREEKKGLSEILSVSLGPNHQLPLTDRVTCALDKITEGVCFHQWFTFEIQQIRCLLEAILPTTEQPIYTKSLQTEPTWFKPQDLSRPGVTYLQTLFLWPANL